MAKDDGQSSQLNLTVVALVALVAIVGLVALVLNTASLAKISTGATFASADVATPDANVAGQSVWAGCSKCLKANNNDIEKCAAACGG